MKEYTLSEIKVAAYNWQELPDMTPRQRALWQGLGYCYDWNRQNPDQTEECKALSDDYIKFFWGDDI